MTETAQPSCVRRTVAFSRAVTEGEARVEDLTARLAHDRRDIYAALAGGHIPVIVDPDAAVTRSLRPVVIIDAIIAKRNTGTAITDAPLVIGVGPGFTAGVDCHYAVETQRGHRLGRVITARDSPPHAEPNTGIPGPIGGYTSERLLRAPAAGVWRPRAAIADQVAAGALVAAVRTTSGEELPVYARITGVVRGLLPDGYPVTPRFKCGDIDPRCDRNACYTVSDKALAIAGGVLEAICRRINV
jgi:xanthine dehydrogenase accessory factor